jgi:hypothetical protein
MGWGKCLPPIPPHYNCGTFITQYSVRGDAIRCDACFATALTYTIPVFYLLFFVCDAGITRSIKTACNGSSQHPSTVTRNLHHIIFTFLHLRHYMNSLNVVIPLCSLFICLQNSSQNTTYNINYALQRLFRLEKVIIRLHLKPHFRCTK